MKGEWSLVKIARATDGRGVSPAELQSLDQEVVHLGLPGKRPGSPSFTLSPTNWRRALQVIGQDQSTLIAYVRQTLAG